MQVALDEGPGPPIKHQYPDLFKLHQVVSQLVRCSDITSECSNPNEAAILPNPYGEPHINPEDRPKLSKEAMQYLFQKTAYVFFLSFSISFCLFANLFFLYFFLLFTDISKRSLRICMLVKKV